MGPIRRNLPAMDSPQTYWAARAALDWQVALGATEAIQDSPVDRYALTAPAPARPAKKAGAEPPVPVDAPAGRQSAGAGAVVDAVAVADAAAAAAPDLQALAAAMAAFTHCELKKGARNCVFADGQPAARVMIIGEAPGAEEDRAGKPFVGRAGQLLDRMFAAINLARDAEAAAQALYITNVLPWRPPSNRTPERDEIAMMLPFLQRHIALADPDFLVLMGNTPCQALLGKTGITRIRGTWDEVLGKPALPMVHPAYLLRNPIAKREAWADLLALKARLAG